MKAYVKYIAYYLPEIVISNEKLVNEFPEWTVDKIASKVGVNNRHVADEQETALDMAVSAADILFRNHSDLNRENIDFVLFCTQSPDYFLPTSACIIQERLNLQTNIGAIDYNLGCSGYVYGLAIAKGLIAGGIAKNVLLLTAETYSKYIHPKDKGNRTIFGDAASASIVSTEGFAEIGEFSLGTDGKGADNLIVRTGASRVRKVQNDLVFDENGNPVSSDYLYMNGTEIFTFTQKNVPIVVKDTLMKNEIEHSDIDLFVLHQANKYMLNFLRKKMKIEEERFYCFMSEVGNTVSNSIPIALCEAMRKNRLKGNVLLAGFGVGYSWGGTILKVR